MENILLLMQAVMLLLIGLLGLVVGIVLLTFVACTFDDICGWTMRMYDKIKGN